MINNKEIKIAIIGLGYVGLPLAIEFSKKHKVLGFDINKKRIEELQQGKDHTMEVDVGTLKKCMQVNGISKTSGLSFSYNADKLRSCNVFIVTVPTPIDRFNNPDLRPLLSASRMLGGLIEKKSVIIYESTTYPGCTEEDCVPAIEEESGFRFNEDFYVGYSPERINPGDKVNTLTKIKKVTSGSTPEIADFVNNLYSSIITAGTHKAPSIKVAEASKIIENAQRDVNISFVNELSLIFDKVGIDTNDVLEAAGTKWNFLKYRPGLVGGHCISVDPYYLAKKAESLGYIPQVILSGRNVNNSIAHFIADKVIKLMIQKEHLIKGADVLILGITFKENCPDIRNTKVVEIYRELKEFGVNVEIHDPWASSEEVYGEYGITLSSKYNKEKTYSAIILAVAHDEFKTINFEKHHKSGGVLFDVKAVIDRKWVDARL
ncbi:nucleotide sugar dehydrogenase [Petrimonas sulfuriphila]|jgi:UDP-N-acetyl-D-galactosamine dehydrogenase|uniref:nucleotide sugar dehydrogenase n=1 Tax=Petrimonas sulfuriphila TaxID=285070 RepID=UPI003EBA687D